MANNIYDYSKLLGRLKEKNLTQDQLAAKIGISPASTNLKLCNKSPFKQDEDRKSTRLNSSHPTTSRMPSSA